jgi:hypothetical protein
MKPDWICGNCGTRSLAVRCYLLSMSVSQEDTLDDGQHVEDTHVYLCPACSMRCGDSLRKLADQYREEIRCGKRVRG